MNPPGRPLPGLQKALRELSREGLLYSLSALLARFTALLIVPIYTRILAPSDYGVIMTLYSALTLVVLGSSLGLETGANKAYWSKDDPAHQRSVLCSWLCTHTLGAALVALPLMAAAGPISRFLFHGLLPPGLLRLGLAALPLQSLTMSFARSLRTQRRAKACVVFSLGLTLTTAACTFLLIVVLRLGMAGFIAGTALANLLVSLWILYDYRRIIRPPFIQASALRTLLQVGLPVLPSLFWGWAISQSAVLFITRFHPPEAAATYYLSNTIATGAGLFMAIFQQAWVPFTFSIARAEYRLAFMNLSLRLYATAGATLAWALTLLSPFLFRIIAPAAYHHAAQATCLLAFSYIAAGALSIFSTEACLQSRATRVATGTVLGGVTALVGHLVLTRHMGPQGAALTILAANLLNVSSLAFLVRHKTETPLDLAPGALPFLGVLSSALLATSEGSHPALVLTSHAIAVAILGVAWIRNIRELRTASRYRQEPEKAPL